MRRFQRYAIYVLPQGPLARFGAAWLGWDAATGTAVPHPDIPDLPRAIAEITATPRKYGLHATIKPPFRLAPDSSMGALMDDMARLCADQPHVTLDALVPARLGSFLALVPQGPTQSLSALAEAAVTRLDRHRAPLTDDELTRRRAANLTPDQEALLLRWGYPYVLDAFRFHITLSGKLPKAEAEATLATLTPHLAPLLDATFIIDNLCLLGEAEDGMFHLIHRYPLGAAASRSNTATSA